MDDENQEGEVRFDPADLKPIIKECIVSNDVWENLKFCISGTRDQIWNNFRSS